MIKQTASSTRNTAANRLVLITCVSVLNKPVYKRETWQKRFFQTFEIDININGRYHKPIITRRHQPTLSNDDNADLQERMRTIRTINRFLIS
jgi:hypothetical protein